MQGLKNFLCNFNAVCEMVIIFKTYLESWYSDTNLYLRQNCNMLKAEITDPVTMMTFYLPLKLNR